MISDQEYIRRGFQAAGDVFLAIHIEIMFHQIEDENQCCLHNLMAARILSWLPPDKYRAMIKDVARVILDHTQEELTNGQKTKKQD